jgi:DNA-binding response OmpR family regulator
MLRINAILRRGVKNSAVNTDGGHIIYEKEGFKADMTAYKVFIDGVQADMAPKEYDLLFFLVRNKNIAVPREKILTEVWGYDYYGDDRTLDTHIKLLRKSLGPYAHFITTLRGLGYRFDG